MTTIEDIKRMIDTHDYWYSMSDDHSVWKRGQDSYDRIQRALNDAEGETATAARAYWKEHCARMNGA